MTATRQMRPSRARPAPASSSGTRDRILLEAAELIARHGYQATTTRDIAKAVGIRQPSLFHHFPSKASIVEALLEWDLGRVVPRVERIARASESAAARLYAYLQADVTHLATARYNLSGIYTEEVMGRDEFVPWAERRRHLHDTIEGIVRDGIRRGEFMALDSRLVREAIAGILVGALNAHSGSRRHSSTLGSEVARLIVRGLLAEPALIDAVGQSAHGLEGLWNGGIPNEKASHDA